MYDAPDQDEITRWALAAQRGDSAATAMFIRATQADVWRMCAHLGSPGAADDLTQETYLRAFKSLRRFAARASARTWLLSIARRVCADYVREQRRRPRVVPLEIAEATAIDGVDFASLGALRGLVEGLAPDRKEAFVLTQILGLSYQDAADVAGCPIGTIRSRVARAREELVSAVHTAEGTPDDLAMG